MKCPHCTVEIHFAPEIATLESDIEGDWGVQYQECPACNKFIIFLVRGEFSFIKGRENEHEWIDGFKKINHKILVRPDTTLRPPCPPEVPALIAEDYLEACKTLTDSPKASAALSRRCLQSLLREYAHVKPADLAVEIQEVIDSNTLSSEIADEIDAIRHIGNFAAHPMKSKKSGEVLPVEPAEAEWNLEVLENLFDWFFVQPEKRRKRREELNAKLSDAGKPPLKGNNTGPTTRK